MVRLIASDMDGTLLNEKMVISDINAAAIKEAERHGIKFMIATGRGYSEAWPLLQEAGISCPLITLNGAQIIDGEGKVLESIGLEKKTVHEILAIFNKHNLYAELVTSKGIYSNDQAKRIESVAALITRLNSDVSYKMGVALAAARPEIININYIDDYTAIVDDPAIEVLKLLAFSTTPDKLTGAKAELTDMKHLAITASSQTNIEINHVKAQKGIALTKVARKLDIPMSEVMSIGDNFNDVSMLQAADVSFAMGNAEEEVKKQAKYMTSDNNDNGVAEAIFRVINEKL